MSWIIICRTCSDCGGTIGFKITENKPTQEDINWVAKELGGAYCISEYVKEIDEDIVNVIDPD